MARPHQEPPKPKPVSPLPYDVATAAEMKGMMPLEYMLSVLNGGSAGLATASRSAWQFAPRDIFIRGRRGVSKKQLLTEAASRAGPPRRMGRGNGSFF